ncbi:golgin subfamily A member 6-like protein 22 [Nilaparvata lugens]|uniref:golgin subfamily A member 6-like protein 22 n=1 Tax=Nilaparvata lugens TaxID=108931 RepID=UPI00193CFD8C|nr:golgin subfamily A member 6-like protein 22 [Nilaparvata lugens]
MGTLSEDLYASQQINVPLNLPYILKQYAKAAIKTQPRDLLHWSSAYFRALANGDVPPVKDRIEYPLISTPSGLTAGFLRILIKQFGKSGIIEEKELIKKWKGVGLEIDELHNMLRLCGFRKTVRWLNFVAVAAGFLSPNLTQTMILLCELLTDEPEGGSAAILYQTFMTLYIYLARMDCGPICHLKSSMVDGFSDEVPSDDVAVGKADEQSEEKSSENLSDIEVALERKPTLDSNDSAQGVMVWEDVTHPDMVVQESTAAEEDVVTEADIADNIPVDVVDEPTTVDNEEEDKADDKESVKSTESYDNTGITLTFHDPEQDVRIDDYMGPIEPKLKRRYEKRLEEEQRDETDNKAETDETKDNEGEDDGVDHEEEGKEQGEENEQKGEEKTNVGEEVVEVDKEEEKDGDRKVEGEVENGERVDETGEGVGKLDEVEGNEGDDNDVVEEKGEGVKSEKDGGGEGDVVEKESEIKVEEESHEEQHVEESDKVEGKTSAEIKDSDKIEESGGERGDKIEKSGGERRQRKKRKKEAEEGEGKEEGEEEESDHEEQSRYEYSLELEEEEEHEKVEEEEKGVKEETVAVESGEEVKEEAKVEEEAGKEEEEEEEELKEEQSADLESTDSAVPLQGQRKSDIEVYGCLHLPKHRNLSFTDSIVSEPDNHFWEHVPGIGPLVPEKQILGLKAYFLYWSEKQNGYVMPRNIKHHLCPTMEPPVIEREKTSSVSDAEWVHDVRHGDSIIKDDK